ncbi:MAG: T9SS type A sorting domain-containing protein [Melioribacteraceae bacterium]|nr:T9SS type A sorting domain-containing protein [Melioribacteraceae bacterium]
MKNLPIILTILLLIAGSVFAQTDQNADPDSLIEIAIQGVAIVDTSHNHSRFFLDENNDGSADYKLNFGPYWYYPDSSGAVRPADGDEITIFGGMHVSDDSMNVVVVYEINGEFWRDPFEPFWNNFTRHKRFGRQLQGGARGFAFGWMKDTLRTTTVSGTALVDTTLRMNQFYLDENGDGYPDYFLNFGPYWYVPQSGAIRPIEGDEISVTGGLISRDSLDAIVVYEFNGVVWRDSASFGRHIRGKWFRKNMTGKDSVHNPFDPNDHFTVNQNWHPGGAGDDSLFGQMMEVYPQNIPNSSGQNAFCGFEVGLFDDKGVNRMWQNNRAGGNMHFNSSVKYQLHYSDSQLNVHKVDEEKIEVKFWDSGTNDWQKVDEVTIDTDDNTVSFESNSVSSLIILSGDNVTSTEDEYLINLPAAFTMEQNYPNPFNPETRITFSLPSNSLVKLIIYNILGEKVAVLINKNLNAGYHSYNFNASGLTSGVYLYELIAGSSRIVKKMSLAK